jgi:dipeptidyl aminopeptidase/acylaminoacyl peptidase
VNVTSVVTYGLKPERYWFDIRWAKVQASVDAELPNRVNVISGNPEAQVLVASYGDVDPGRWFFLDVPTMSMREVTAANERIDPKRMRPMETLRYKARDGLDVPAYLTRPARAQDKPAPMVVLIHGGPNVRDGWAWNEEVQVLASYGYVVFQPQFRGSAGFGQRFQEAGYLQWGLAMQDDITDGVNELVRRKIADPNRICVYGASYGGYAALWGVIKDPTLYKCGISFAGVSDLEAMMSGSIFDDSNSISREINRVRIGDLTKQREQFAQVSPLKNAARVQVPLLIAHGEEDTRVLISQSQKMVAALKANGKSVEWMSFPREGHGLFWEADRKRYYAAMLSFLQRHIGDTNVAEPVNASASSAAP